LKDNQEFELIDLGSQGFRKVFPCIIRDALVVDEGPLTSRSVLVNLQSGVLMVLNNEFQLIKSFRVTIESFARKPAPTLEIH
jgi:hypothetical protein